MGAIVEEVDIIVPDTTWRDTTAKFQLPSFSEPQLPSHPEPQLINTQPGLQPYPVLAVLADIQSASGSGMTFRAKPVSELGVPVKMWFLSP